MKFYLTIEKDDEVLFEVTAPTYEILSEKVGAWERKVANERAANLDTEF